MRSAEQGAQELTARPAAAEDGPEMNVTLPRGVTLQAIQLPIRGKLDDVSRAMGRIVASDLPLVGQVSAHLMAMRGKMFRPTLLLFSSEVAEEPGEQAVSLAAALELIHLASWHADRERTLQSSGLRHHGRLSVLHGADAPRWIGRSQGASGADESVHRNDPG